MRYRLQQAGRSLRRRATVLRGMMHLDDHDPAGTVLLAGSGRSGTTWLGQIINADHDYREVFEPLFPDRVKQVADFPTTRYITANDHDPALARRIGALLEGRVRNAWTDQFNRKLIAHQRLIKVIRGNLMLGYIRQSFPQVKLCFATRHPCAVALSRLKLGWAPHLHELLAQTHLVNDHLLAHRETIARVMHHGDLFDQHIVMWCIENAVPLRELRPGDACVLQYERFCDDFKNQTRTLFGFLDRPIPRRIDAAAKKVSPHFRRDSAVLHGESLTGGWRHTVTTPQLDRVLAYLDAFGLGHLYGSDEAPRCEPDAAFISVPPPAAFSHEPADTPAREAA